MKRRKRRKLLSRAATSASSSKSSHRNKVSPMGGESRRVFQPAGKVHRREPASGNAEGNPRPRDAQHTTYASFLVSKPPLHSGRQSKDPPLAFGPTYRCKVCIEPWNASRRRRFYVFPMQHCRPRRGSRPSFHYHRDGCTSRETCPPRRANCCWYRRQSMSMPLDDSTLISPTEKITLLSVCIRLIIHSRASR